ncbi:MAG: hypothetical protein ACHQDD_01445 [Steroidobacterales bacterium]
MSKAPPPESPPDELIDAYRRASADERSRPSEQVRASILARSRLVVSSRDRSAERALASAPPAANESRWKWKLAASLAAVAMAGLLAVQTFVTLPRGATPTRSDAGTESAPRVAEVTPAPASSDSVTITVPPPAAAAHPGAREQSGARAGDEANAPSRVAPTPPLQATVPEPRAAAPALSRADASRTEALTARLRSPMNSMGARAAAPVLRPQRDQAIAALHATFPELFAGPAIAGNVPVAMVLNSDGTVYRIGREEPTAADQADAASQVSRALGVGPEELESPAQFLTLDRTAAQANTIVVALGIRKMQAGPTRDAH